MRLKQPKPETLGPDSFQFIRLRANCRLAKQLQVPTVDRLICEMGCIHLANGYSEVHEKAPLLDGNRAPRDRGRLRSGPADRNSRSGCGCCLGASGGGEGELSCWRANLRRYGHMFSLWREALSRVGPARDRLRKTVCRWRGQLRLVLRGMNVESRRRRGSFETTRRTAGPYRRRPQRKNYQSYVHRSR